MTRYDIYLVFSKRMGTERDQESQANGFQNGDLPLIKNNARKISQNRAIAYTLAPIWVIHTKMDHYKQWNNSLRVGGSLDTPSNKSKTLDNGFIANSNPALLT